MPGRPPSGAGVEVEHGLAAQVADTLGRIAIPCLAQTGQSDQNLLIRLAQWIGTTIARISA